MSQIYGFAKIVFAATLRNNRHYASVETDDYMFKFDAMQKLTIHEVYVSQTMEIFLAHFVSMSLFWFYSFTAGTLSDFCSWIRVMVSIIQSSLYIETLE